MTKRKINFIERASNLSCHQQQNLMLPGKKAHKIIGNFARTVDFCLVWLFCFDGIRQTNHVPGNKTSALPTHMADNDDDNDDNKHSIFSIELSSP